MATSASNQGSRGNVHSEGRLLLNYLLVRFFCAESNHPKRFSIFVEVVHDILKSPSAFRFVRCLHSHPHPSSESPQAQDNRIQLAAVPEGAAKDQNAASENQTVASPRVAHIDDHLRRSGIRPACDARVIRGISACRLDSRKDDARRAPGRLAEHERTH